jgi:hypothetical protein
MSCGSGSSGPGAAGSSSSSPPCFKTVTELTLQQPGSTNPVTGWHNDFVKVGGVACCCMSSCLAAFVQCAVLVAAAFPALSLLCTPRLVIKCCGCCRRCATPATPRCNPRCGSAARRVLLRGASPRAGRS